VPCIYSPVGVRFELVRVWNVLYLTLRTDPGDIKIRDKILFWKDVESGFGSVSCTD